MSETRGIYNMSDEAYVVMPHTACRPSGFDEYDNLTGYVTRVYRKEWRDKRGNLWRRTTTIVNLGRPDRGRAKDPDAQLESEELPSGGEAPAHREAVLASRERKHGAILKRVAAYLEEHGPSLLVDLRSVAGYSESNNVLAHLRMFPNVYYCYGTRPHVWGLYGQSYTPAPRPPIPAVVRMEALLREQGPMLVSEISKRVGVAHRTTGNLLNQHRDTIFVKVGEKLTSGGQMASLWYVKEAE